METGSLELIDHNIGVLREAAELLEDIGVDLYVRPGGAGSPSSPGMHVRHVIDHYTSFITGLDAGRVDYDTRDRDPRIETDPGMAREAITGITQRLAALRGRIATGGFSADAAVTVCCTTAVDQSPGLKIRSTLDRELAFLHGHAIHHYALIRMLLAGQGTALRESFGVSPGTLAFRDRMPAAPNG